MFQPLEEQIQRPLPETVEQVVERLFEDISLRDKVKIANLSEEELESSFYRAMAQPLRKEFKLFSGNTKLLDSCCSYIGWKYPEQEEPTIVLIKELWGKAKSTYSLRLVQKTSRKSERYTSKKLQVKLQVQMMYA